MNTRVAVGGPRGTSLLISLLENPLAKKYGDFLVGFSNEDRTATKARGHEQPRVVSGPSRAPLGPLSPPAATTERKKTDTPREGWEPPHRTTQEFFVVEFFNSCPRKSFTMMPSRSSLACLLGLVAVTNGLKVGARASRTRSAAIMQFDFLKNMMPKQRPTVCASLGPPPVLTQPLSALLLSSHKQRRCAFPRRTPT